MDVFEALADPTRRDMMWRLAADRLRVVDLSAAYAVSRPAVSRHLRLLGDAGLVSAEDRGRERHYRLERGGLEPVSEFLTALVRPVAQPAGVRIDESVLDALDTAVRRTRRDRARTARTDDRQEDAG